MSRLRFYFIRSLSDGEIRYDVHTTMDKADVPYPEGCFVDERPPLYYLKRYENWDGRWTFNVKN